MQSAQEPVLEGRVSAADQAINHIASAIFESGLDVHIIQPSPIEQGRYFAHVWAVDPELEPSGWMSVISCPACSMQRSHVFDYTVFEVNGKVFFRGPSPNGTSAAASDVHRRLAAMGYAMDWHGRYSKVDRKA